MINNLDILTEAEKEKALSAAISDKLRRISENKVPEPYFKETVISPERFTKLLERHCKNATITGEVIEPSNSNSNFFRLHIENASTDFYVDIRFNYHKDMFFVTHAKLKTEENNVQQN